MLLRSTRARPVGREVSLLHSHALLACTADVSDLAPAPSLSPSPASLSLEPTYAPDTVLYPNGSLQQAQGLDVLAAGNIVAEMFLGRSLELGRPLELSSLSPPLRVRMRVMVYL